MLLLPLFCTNLFFACQKPPAIPIFAQLALTAQVEQGDITLLRIAQEARSTLHIFFRYLSRPEQGMDSFCIKYPLPAEDDSGIAMEQVWLTGIHFRNGEYYGLLASAPLFISSMKKGDTVLFDVEEVTDWMYVHNGKIIGGRSILYLLERTPESQYSAYHRELLAMFE